MPSLTNTSKQTIVANNLIDANTFSSRLKGLLGRKNLEKDTAMWIRKCNSIHTWFMQFSIDVVFVDKNLNVTSIHQDVRPWRLLWPQWRADSVFEFAAGEVTPAKVEVGDQLHVDG